MKEKNKTTSIAQKITRSIISIVVACSLIIGLAGMICIAVINAQSRQVYNENLVPLSPLYQTQADFQSIRSDLKSMALEGALAHPSGTDYVSTIADLQSDMQKQLNAYAKNISSDTEQKNYELIASDNEKYKDVISSVEASVGAKNYKEAVETLDSTNQIATEIKSSISKAFTLNTAQAQQRNQTSTTVFYIAIAIILVLAVVFILISLKIAGRSAGGISSPIRKMVDAAESIAEGRLEVDLEIDSTDETGILAESFKNIVASLNLLKTDVNMLIGEALEGRLDTRADVSKHHGDYGAIIGGVNRMFDTIKDPLDVASGFINRLADGEHQENIENTYKGYYAELIDNLNRVRTSVAILVTEATKLAQAGVRGDLDVRGDETAVKGAFAQVIHGVNQTFDAIKTPLDVASEFIGNLRDGKGQPDIDNIYQGYYATLVDNLNSVRQSFAYLIGETSKLIQAGRAGDLSVRGNTGALKGGFAEIVDGFNQTLESIVSPLGEGMSVLAKMSVNDYTTSMTGEYNGMLADFAQSINEVLATLKRIENVFILMSKGDFSPLEQYKRIGRRNENDHLMPSVIAMLQALVDLIEQSRILSEAALVGNLNLRGDDGKFEGGYRSIIEGMNRTMQAFSEPIEETAVVLQKFSEGDLTAEITGQYQGEYNRIKTSVNETISAISLLLGDISVSAGQVAVGSKQVSDGSQSLSQGATEQASSIEELTSSIAEVAAQTKQNAVNASQASDISTTVQEEAAQGNEKMRHMLDSMREINESSGNISKIIKVIDDIAFQTNILALNAAVEAARAGQYGKGFAVVAEEVRNLAAKSAEAAKDTTALIEGSIKTVENGTNIANETADMLNKISQSIQKTSDLIRNIATASNDQATAIAQIDTGITQVSTVVQTNSATAEESAASSEELSGQADTLIQMVGRFRLKKSVSEPATADKATPAAHGSKQSLLSEAKAGPSISLSGEYGKY